ncbi:MAG: hypothetical protein FJ184_06125 [Gammaproteobacteria bacterium]|nr:hypothetical protein [Gammaproteobacteria bacterium]
MPRKTDGVAPPKPVDKESLKNHGDHNLPEQAAVQIIVGFGALTPGRMWQLMETDRGGRPGDGRSARIPMDARGQATIASAIGTDMRRFRLETMV